jgi:hypothetical protein
MNGEVLMLLEYGLFSFVDGLLASVVRDGRLQLPWVCVERDGEGKFRRYLAPGFRASSVLGTLREGSPAEEACPSGKQVAGSPGLSPAPGDRTRQGMAAGVRERATPWGGLPGSAGSARAVLVLDVRLGKLDVSAGHGKGCTRSEW